jgi:hypothetical protein
MLGGCGKEGMLDNMEIGQTKQVTMDRIWPLTKLFGPVRKEKEYYFIIRMSKKSFKELDNINKEETWAVVLEP